MRWAGLCNTCGERRGACRVWWGHLRERNHLEDPSVEGRIILRWIVRVWDEGTWNGLIWLRKGTGGGLL